MARRYTKVQVQELRDKRKFSKPKGGEVTQEFWDKKLGRLLAAGHLRIGGFNTMQINREQLDIGFWNTPLAVESETKTLVDTTISFKTIKQNSEYGDAPHITGYLESASNADKRPYRIKGWFNPDGTIRLELVD